MKAAFTISFLGLAISSTHASALLPRGPQTNATCLNNYNWMDNESGLSSCLVAAYVMTACGTANFAVLALVDNSHYDPPGVGGDSVNSCSCSWAGYNMLMACTACQGFDDSIFGWAPWKQKCDDEHLSNTTYFPFDEDFVIGTTLPYWAGQNPLNWDGGRFDAVAARNLSDEGHKDLNGTDTTGSDQNSNNDNGSSSPVGPIVGGVVGGLAVIGGTAFIAWWLLRRHRRLAARQRSNSSSELMFTNKHNRTVSDFTEQTHGNMSIVPTSVGDAPSIMGSGQSYFGSMHGSSQFMSPPASPAPRLPAPMTPVPMSAVRIAPQDVIVPFTGTHSPQHSLSTNDRKEGISLTYESPGALSVHGQDDSFSTAGESTVPSRRNPPAYTPSASYPAFQQRVDDSVSSGSLSMGHRAGKESQDTTLSYATTNRMSIRNPTSAEPGVGEFGTRAVHSPHHGEDEDDAEGVDRPVSPPYTPGRQRDNVDASNIA